MTFPNKTFCTVRTFSFKNHTCYPIYKLLNTMYGQYIDKQGCKGVLNIVSGVKYQFFVCLAIYNVCYELYGFLYIA